MNRGSPSYTYNYPINQNFSPPNHTQPLLSVAFPELNKMADGDLAFLNENIDEQQQFVENLPQLRDINSAIDEAIAQIEELTGIRAIFRYLKIQNCWNSVFVRFESFKMQTHGRTAQEYRIQNRNGNKTRI